ncbi:hypothetical protein GCM10010411_74190 [Actinomadura fulvescens]|uniref:Resolvase/invertase-type recombinase catalytic domain-containing protein n=1 Tax=Actinomadura fulvescens TaxID=46160 RepID=A0ABP6CWR1_9ACTN
MFDPPLDLSALPGYLPAPSTRPCRTAFLGRCSTKDHQDPAASIAGQVAEASLLLAPGEQFAAYYWDVESGMLGLDERSQATDADYARLSVPVRRDGGIEQLLRAAERGDIDRVVCERISRAARKMLSNLQVEEHLTTCGVRLDCANEPQGGMTTGRLEVRRMGQVRAEIARAELMEMSMRGQRQHAANGYRHGKPCYGYIAVIDPNAPRPADRFGTVRPKQRLALHPDQRRQATVALGFRLRRDEGLGDTEIGRVLAADLHAHPPGEDMLLWNGRHVRRMLAQPKYTGFQVFGRRSSRADHERVTPISQWVWSRQQAHPAIITVQEWYDTQLVTAQLRDRRRPGWGRVRQAATDHGVTLTQIGQSSTHALWDVGGRRIVLPTGELPAAVADQMITLLEQIAR